MRILSNEERLAVSGGSEVCIPSEIEFCPDEPTDPIEDARRKGNNGFGNGGGDGVPGRSDFQDVTR